LDAGPHPLIFQIGIITVTVFIAWEIPSPKSSPLMIAPTKDVLFFFDNENCFDLRKKNPKLPFNIQRFCSSVF
jgi:hypothetical protein